MRHRQCPTIFALAIAALLVAAPESSKAHEFEPERELLVQVFAEHVDIMVVYVEAPGERTDLFLMQYGFGIDGVVGQLMREMARVAILPRMLDGLEFEVKGEEPRTGTPQVEFRDHDSRLMAAAYVRYELDELDPGQKRTMIVRSEDQSFIPTPATVYPGDDLEMASDVDASPIPAHTYELFRDHEESTVFVRP